jgi:DNA-binding CsgD family transcriptional regulator
MQWFDAAFESALRQVEGAADLAELQQAVLGILAPYGLRHAVYYAIRLPGVEEERPFLVFSYPQAWIDHYFARRYNEIDPVVRNADRSVLPIDWGTVDRSAPPVQRLFGEAEDAGLGRQGITLPIRGAQGDLAIFTVTSEADDAEWDRLRSFYVRDMQTLGTYVHARVLALSGVAQPDYAARLSRRERECLQWAALGYTIAGTAEKLHLSERVVRGYLDSARHKLDCLTKPQAVAKAAALRIVQPR